MQRYIINCVNTNPGPCHLRSALHHCILNLVTLDVAGLLLSVAPQAIALQDKDGKTSLDLAEYAVKEAFLSQEKKVATAMRQLLLQHKGVSD